MLRGALAHRQKLSGACLYSVIAACKKVRCDRYPPNPGGNHGVNDNDDRPVTIITGRVKRGRDDRFLGVHVLLVAPDDDSAVRTALEALAREGYAEAELDQIGDMEGAPEDEPHASAHQGALEGEVSIVTFDEEF
jgi:hypothetical protein